MSAIIYAKRIKCDCCQVQAEVTEPFTNPLDWTCIMNLQIGNRAWNIDLCSACSTLPFGSLITRLTELLAAG